MKTSAFNAAKCCDEWQYWNSHVVPTWTPFIKPWGE